MGNIKHMSMHFADVVREFGIVAGAAAIIGMGQLLASDEKLTLRLVLGRAICSAGLGACSGLLVVLVPDLAFETQLAVACTLASLGTSFLERMANRAIGSK